MKNILVILATISLLALSSYAASSQQRVQGYWKRNGTYVQPHYRTYRDNNRFNNWSVSPNVNPYTGRRGTRSPYATPTPRYSPFGTTRRRRW